MAQHIDKPEKRTFWKVTQGDIIHEGYTNINQVTSTGDAAVIDQSQSPEDIYPPLPDSGLLPEGKTYAWNGKAVTVTQEHNRTEFTPDQTPNLFSITRPNTENMPWIEQEEVEVGDERIDNDIAYICIIPHLTQFRPSVATNLWKVKQGGGIIDWFVPDAINYYSKDQLMRYTDGNVYKSLIDVNTWSPQEYEAGWEIQPDLS